MRARWGGLVHYKPFLSEERKKRKKPISFLGGGEHPLCTHKHFCFLVHVALHAPSLKTNTSAADSSKPLPPPPPLLLYLLIHRFNKESESWRVKEKRCAQRRAHEWHHESRATNSQPPEELCLDNRRMSSKAHFVHLFSFHRKAFGDQNDVFICGFTFKRQPFDLSVGQSLI